MIEQSRCFHCGLAVLPGAAYTALIDGQPQPMCCHGCQAVAEAIVAAGLSDFYRHRTATSRRAEDLIPEALRGLELYDRPDLQKDFVHLESEHVRDAALMLEGIVCAACVWLSERHVGQLPGVLEFRVNYSTHRARVRWDERQIRLSEILAALSAIGYLAHPFDARRQEAAQQRERSIALRRLAVAGLGSMQVMMMAVALYAGDYHGMDAWIQDLLRWACLVLAIPVVVYSAQPFYQSAWRDLRRQRLGMDVPVTLAIVTAFIASVWYTWRGGGEVYYDSVTMFVFFLLAGRFLEMSARHRAGQISEALVRMLPATATRLGATGEQIVPIAELAIGDRVLVRPGETIPADGLVLEGSSSVDESLLTGESLPLQRSIGEQLVGGAVNVESPLVMRVDKLGPDTVLSAIVRLLDRAQSEKPRLALLADQLAGWFIAALLVVATVVLLSWWSVSDFDTAFRVTLSVLVVTCPCALSLATPTAIVAATGALTRLGLLVSRGHALETLAQATHVLFDKTGTLTYGRPHIVTVESVGPVATDECLALAGALERGSEHPVGQALAMAAEAAGFRREATGLTNTPGSGIEGWIDGRRYRVGRAAFVTALSGQPLSERIALAPADTWIALGDEVGMLAWFQLADSIRPGAAETVVALQQLGLTVELLSGDRPEAVAHVADQVAIATAHGDRSPEGKLARVRELQAQGKVVAVVGDGINDAPVLAAAQISLAMGGGTQLAHASADMILLSERLEHLVWGVEMARKTVKVIRENFAWAIGYNLLALPLAAGGWLTPWLSALGMSLSSLVVVANALRLRQV